MEMPEILDSNAPWGLMTPQEGFLGLPEERAVSYDEAKAVIIPFGLEASVSYRGGTSKGPQAMITASHYVELFDEHFWCEPYQQIGIATLKEGVIKRPQEDALSQLEAMVEQTLQDGKFPLVFGGEHAITPGAIRPFVRRHPELVILHFDAHADLRDGYEGEPYSHASAMRRCLDHDHVSLVSVGIRSISAEEISYLEANRHRIHMYWAKDKQEWNLKQLVSHLKGKSVYLSFDIDGFDASLIPATGTPEPGGLFWNEALEVITEAAKVCTIVGADINELAPIDGMHSCDFLAAKLAYKILAYAFLKQGR